MDVPVTSSLRFSRGIAGVCLIGFAAFLVLPCMHAEAKQNKPHKESKRADTREIEALEAKWRDAMVKGDSAELEPLLAEDFFGISSNGTVSDKGQYLQRLTSHNNQFSAIELMDQKVRMQPTTVIVVSQARVIGQLNGRPINGVFRYTKVYGREAGAWRVLNYEATRVSGSHADDSDMRLGTPLSRQARAH